jgi:hypothetical protein
MNFPPGVAPWPSDSSPQQTTLPSIFNPHACPAPVPIAMNFPFGGVLAFFG